MKCAFYCRCVRRCGVITRAGTYNSQGNGGGYRTIAFLGWQHDQRVEDGRLAMPVQQYGIAYSFLRQAACLQVLMSTFLFACRISSLSTLALMAKEDSKSMVNTFGVT